MDAQTKKCPMCGEEIKAEARICRFCRAKFVITVQGYCTNCHEIREADENGNCQVCGREIMDRRINSQLIEEPLGAPVSPPLKPAQPSTPPPLQVAAPTPKVEGMMEYSDFGGALVLAIAANREAEKRHLMKQLVRCENCQKVIKAIDAFKISGRRPNDRILMPLISNSYLEVVCPHCGIVILTGDKIVNTKDKNRP